MLTLLAGALLVLHQAPQQQIDLREIWVLYRECLLPSPEVAGDDGMTWFRADIVNRGNHSIASLTFDCRLLHNENGKSDVVWHQQVEVPVEGLEVNPKTCELQKSGTVLHHVGRMRLLTKLKAPPEAVKAENAYWIELVSAREQTSTLPKDSIFDAARAGDLDALESILKKRPTEVSSRDSDGNTPLHIACISGREGVIAALLRGGADVSARNRFDMQPIHYAAAAQGPGASYSLYLEPLVEGGADPNAKSKSTGTPISIAAYHSDASSVKYLLRKGADPNLKTSWSGAVVQAIRGQARGPECLTAILQGGGDPNSENMAGQPALLIAADRYDGGQAFVDLLLRAGAKVDLAYKKTGETALHIAAKDGNIGLVQLLLSRGADRSIKNVAGKTALDLANEGKHADVVAALEKK